MLQKITVMTYNVHSCIGSDGACSPQRVAAVIARKNPDIIALQELDCGRPRTGYVDQAKMIAERLRMDHHFQPTLELEEGLYGNAVMSRYPMRLIKGAELPSLPGRMLEKRGAIWVEVTLPHYTLQVISTHLGLNRNERLGQADVLLGEEWLGHPDCRPPVILCGDFNALPGYSAHRRIRTTLQDVQMRWGLTFPRRTWPSRYPVLSIDHIFVTPDIFIFNVTVPRCPMTRMASDHLPLVAELLIS